MNHFELAAKILELIQTFTALNTDEELVRTSDGSYEFVTSNSTHEVRITIHQPEVRPPAEEVLATRAPISVGDRVLLVDSPNLEAEYQIVFAWDDHLILEYDGAENAEPGNMIVAEKSGELHETWWICSEQYAFDGWDGSRRRILRWIDPLK